MIRIEEYILLPIEKRQAHLRLDEPCVERGGNPRLVSCYMRGALADAFDTTMPKGIKISACHACHNGKCSNLRHLYWGTAKENRADADRIGLNARTAWQRTVDKYGIEKALEMSRHNGFLGGTKYKRKRGAVAELAYAPASRADVEQTPVSSNLTGPTN